MSLTKRDKKLIATGSALASILCVIILLRPFKVVGAGEVGVRTSFGKVEQTTLQEGLAFRNPFCENIKTLNARMQRLEVNTIAQTKDIQVARIGYILNYAIDKHAAHTIYQDIGADYERIAIIPVAEGIVKDAIGKWIAQDLIANREQASSEILENIQREMGRKHILVSGLHIVSIEYSESFMHAIEAKVTAEQQALQAKNKTVQVQEEAKQQIISAEAEAKSMQIRAEALSSNQGLIDYEAVSRWDGRLPEIMSGAIPFINLNKK